MNAGSLMIQNLDLNLNLDQSLLPMIQLIEIQKDYFLSLQFPSDPQ